MKKRYSLFAIAILLSCLSSCGKEKYRDDLFEVNVGKTYQRYDKFDQYDLTVKYNGITLESLQYSVDLSSFDTSIVGTTSFTVSFNKASWIKRKIDVSIGNRKKTNFLFVGTSLLDGTCKYINQFAATSSLGLEYSFYKVVLPSGSLENHFDNLLQENAFYTMHRFDKNAENWVSDVDITLRSALSWGSSAFDFICFEQEGLLAGVADSYSYLPRLAGAVSSYYESLGKATPSLLFSSTWAYEDGNSEISPRFYQYYGNSQATMHQAIQTCGETIVSGCEQIDFNLNVGRLIENLRPLISSDHALTKDGYHLDDKGSYALGLYINALISGEDCSCFPYNDDDIVTNEERAIIISEINKLV